MLKAQSLEYSDYHLYRYFILASSGNPSLFKIDMTKEEMMNQIWIDLIDSQKTSFIYRGNRFLIYGLKKEGDLLFYKIAKEKVGLTYKEGDSDILGEIGKNWSVVNFVVHPPTQQILIQHESKEFKDSSTPVNALKHYLTGLTVINDYVISIDEKPSKREFWSHLEEATSVYVVSFKLNSLNLELGGSDIRNAINAISDDFNNEELDITLRNRQGNLTLAKDDIKGYIDYIHTLGGKYTLVYKSAKTKVKKAITSFSNIISFKFQSDLLKENHKTISDKLNWIHDKSDDEEE